MTLSVISIGVLCWEEHDAHVPCSDGESSSHPFVYARLADLCAPAGSARPSRSENISGQEPASTISLST